ncbi:MAG: gliding motility-associated ABC transporter permease subunit GldF [Bacteroidetes bacterium]|jgi:ABC-2 type transport system permease protein|nr:gliding motility-associated ABC transporter permease subunit GldF [Bacteroidota bacterium]MBT3750805.1 gliding motility-associated ABC transporter permease subunit GldF [Bacteroidota bacterium]MBT4399877.1 gliding motility-associated ABC transporter permease subunit GldF [Bacteroidota bacterium]MBT4409859.1 gliding motility-associated ABC transporter permease subunit GldF [Bacteroidota bacterium]MBT5427232.1 gliding motility-associated ABC transporter permease subunit GldF [Bacteroidota bact
MLTLFRREINSFFSSLTAYVVIVVFLVMNGLFLWVFPGEFNVIDSGYASLDSMFILAPWLFLFLVPAVTMRLFSDEKRLGTIELLFVRPLTDLQIIMAKFLSGLVLVILSLLPTLIYYLTVYLMGNPVGNIDSGGFWGSFIGLFFLAAVYVSIGLFTSTITENQIVSFILGVLACFLVFLGFDYVGGLGLSGGVQNFVEGLGLSYHYNSMSRGVIDTRDIIYFLSVISIFVVFSKIVLESRKW